MSEGFRQINELIRCLLLIGVTAGLFFSSGEGLQLLPFPPAPARTEKNTAPGKDETYRPYTLSVHNSTPRRAAVKAEIREISNPPAVWPPVERPSLIDGYRPPTADAGPAPAFFPAANLPSALSDRAPPTA